MTAAHRRASQPWQAADSAFPPCLPQPQPQLATAALAVVCAAAVAPRAAQPVLPGVLCTVGQYARAPAMHHL